MTLPSIYISTPIYYVNGRPHIGHAYTTFVADFMARFYRMKQYNVIFSTGTDEHGQKVAVAAEKEGVNVQEFVDHISLQFASLFEKLNLSNYSLVRTSNIYHKAFVQLVLQYLKLKNDIITSEYEGWYCLPCETFFPETQLIEGKCPDCSREVQSIKETCYFFRMSQYLQEIKTHLSNENRLSPQYRHKEVIRWIEDQPDMDLCISRPKKRLSWGIHFPFDEEHVVYVWFDALLNYLSIRSPRHLLEQLQKEDIGQFSLPEAQKWLHSILDNQIKKTPVIHLIGKDILRPHAMYWPAMLIALDFPLPERIYAHGWWTIKGEKMSKSLNNIVDPLELINEFGTDGFRYFLLRETRLGEDGLFKGEAVELRYDTELANDIGNLFSRSLAMLKKYHQSKIPTYHIGYYPEKEIQVLDLVQQALSCNFIEGDLPHKYIEPFLELVRTGNRFIEEKAPWTLFKQNNLEELEQTMGFISSLLHAISFLSEPIIPHAASRMNDSLNISEKPHIDLMNSWKPFVFKPEHLVQEKLLLFPKREKTQ